MWEDGRIFEGGDGGEKTRMGGIQRYEDEMV